MLMFKGLMKLIKATVAVNQLRWSINNATTQEGGDTAEEELRQV